MTTGIEETTTPPPPSIDKSIDNLKPKMEVHGKVVKIELYGAFVDIGVGQDGLLHISQLSTERVKNVNDKVAVGDEITAWVRNVDVAQRRIDLTLIQPPNVTWNEIQVGQELTGKVVRVEKFGAFIDVGAERPGMVHVSELTNGYVNSPSEVVKVGDELRVKVIKVNGKKKQIDLSVKALEEKHEVPREADEDLGDIPTAMEVALRQAMQGTDMGTELMSAPKPKSSRKDNNAKKGNDKQRRQQSEILTRTLQNRVK